MDDARCREFFLEPTANTAQRQYELLRAIFVDNISQREAAARFGYTHGSARQLVHAFRQSIADGGPPPLFGPSVSAGRWWMRPLGQAGADV
jgi:hypothetical protein